MSALARRDRRLLARVAPRGHAKSTCVALAYPLWCLCTRRRRNIVIVTHEASLARQFVCDIRQELESNEAIIADYGDLCGARPDDEDVGSERPATPKRRHTRKAWSQSKFTTNTGITVQAKGSGASFRGLRIGPQRPDLVICDDLEKDEHVASPEGRRKLENWLRRVVMPCLAPDGRLLVLGSLIHHDSLLANLRDRARFPRWDYAVYRAIDVEPQPDGTFRRVALWPARWPLERLDLERERIGAAAFEQEYQANPIDDTRRVFPPERLKRCTEEEVAALTAGRGPGDQLITLMAVDPATGKQSGDFFAVWVGSIDPTSGVIYTRSLTLTRVGVVEQVRLILAAFERWCPVRIGIETTAYQVALKQILEEESRRSGRYLPLVGLATTSNKLARIEGSSAFYENGLFRLPADLDPDAEAQFLHFPKGKHDDAPDVCAMGIELARTLRTATQIEAVYRARGRFDEAGAW